MNQTPEKHLTDAAHELLTTEEASQYTSIPAVTLRQWRHRQEGPRSFKLGGAVRYRMSDLDAWIAYQEQKTAVGGVA